MPETTTLPVTGAVVPAEAARWTVKPTGSMSTRNGVAFTAEVYDGKTLVGTIENLGNGGGTWFHHANHGSYRLWERLVEEYVAANPDDDTIRYVSAECLADALYEEVALARDLDRKRNAVVMRDGDRDQIVVLNRALDDRLRAFLRGSPEWAGCMVWIRKTGWAKP